MRPFGRLEIPILGLLTLVFYFAHHLYSDRGAPRTFEAAGGSTAVKIETESAPVAAQRPWKQSAPPVPARTGAEAVDTGRRQIPPDDIEHMKIDFPLRLIRASRDLPPDRALEQLRPLFSHPRASVRFAALEALADMKHPQRMNLLSAALADPQVDIRVLALDALALEPRLEALPHIEYGLADPNPQVRIAAVDALSEFDPAWVMPGLSAMLYDPDPSVRRFAVSVLGEVGGDEAVAYLLQARFDSDRNTREIAKSILHELDLETGN